MNIRLMALFMKQAAPCRTKVDAMAKEKTVILVVVEGSTDETALALLFSQVFDSSHVVFDITSGDITAKQYLTDEKMRDRVRSRVIEYVKHKPYAWNDLERIVLVTDLDGTFIEDDQVVFHDAGLEYDLDVIRTNKVREITERNHRKARSIEQLVATPYLTYRKARVPFSIYFMSRNLEHALHNVIETVDLNEKERLARLFQRQFSGDTRGFIRFMNSAELAVPGDYVQTWEYVRKGTRSLERGSNLHLLLNE